MTKKFRKVIIIACLAIGSITLWSFVDNDFKIAKSLDIYITLFKELNYNYVDNFDPEKLIKTSIDGMLESLDPYTTYIPESDADDFKFQVSGQYGGIGALIRKIGDSVVIAEPYEGFPAQKFGLKAGDIISKVDGKTVDNKAVSDVSEMLKGEPGTDVNVEILRPGVDKHLMKKITREKITIPNVPYYGIVKDSIGYIRLTNFTPDAGIDVGNALTELKKQHAKAIILDLRNNPGGLLIEAVSVANNFLPKNQLIVFTKGKVKDANSKYTTFNDPIDTVIPLAVLVNHGSASASEIVSGSLQDLDRAVIIGQRTFGKGLVQQTKPLSYNAQLKVTVAKYYIPSGRCIQALDYSHRNEDGSVGYVPDSLIKEYKTKFGRKVYDGGGVQPDAKITDERLSELAYNLYIKNIIFDYATLFVENHKTIKDPKHFTINDSIYNDFTNFVKDKKFEYKTKTEESLNDLIEVAKKEKYYSLAEPELNQLKEKFSHDKNKDLVTFRNEISELITDEIIPRYYYQKGKIEASIIDNDKEVNKAIDIFNTKSLYTNILTGKAGDLANSIDNKPLDKDKENGKKNN
jgi:carboxyl-terminal processing protease